MIEALSVEELSKHEYAGFVSSEAVAEFNALTPEQKEQARFHVALFRFDGDSYDDEAFSLPTKRTPAEAIALVEGCCYNEVEYEVKLVMTYPAATGHGIIFTELMGVCGFLC